VPEHSSGTFRSEKTWFCMFGPILYPLSIVTLRVHWQNSTHSTFSLFAVSWASSAFSTVTVFPHFRCRLSVDNCLCPLCMCLLAAASSTDAKCVATILLSNRYHGGGRQSSQNVKFTCHLRLELTYRMLGVYLYILIVSCGLLGAETSLLK
jgi:hypothetical protein